MLSALTHPPACHGGISPPRWGERIFFPTLSLPEEILED